MNNTELLILQTSIAIQTNVPVLLVGEPGTAKSAILGGIARELKWPFLTKIGSVHDPTDFNGIPWMGEHGVEQRPYRWVRDFSQETLGDRPAMLFLDELNLAPQSVMAAMLRMVHEGYVGDMKLGSRVARVAAMNPPEIANVAALLPAMANRFCQFKWTLSPQYWADAMIAGFPDPQVPRLPASWENWLPQTQALMASYVIANQQHMHVRPSNEADWGGSWPSPRTWAMGAKLLAGAHSISAGDGIEAALLEGCVGTGPAMAFMEYQRKLNLPNPEDVLKNPTGFKYPKKGDQLYAMLNSVVSAVLNNNTEARWQAGWAVMSQCSEDKLDIATASARALAKGMKPGYGPPMSAKVFYRALQLAGLAPEKTVVV